MKPEMSEKELRELDAWIEVNVFGWVPETRKMFAGSENVKGYGFNTHLNAGSFGRDFCPECAFPRNSYTTDPAASDALDDAIRKKCCEDGYSTYMRGENVHMLACIPGLDAHAIHRDKKICRSLLAKQIWSKE